MRMRKSEMRMKKKQKQKRVRSSMNSALGWLTVLTITSQSTYGAR